MSHSPTEFIAGDEASEYLKNWDSLGALISRGYSFSGRERNCCFLNTGQPIARDVTPFADVSAAATLDLDDDSRGVAATDWDHDGDLDLWISTRTAPGVRFLRNDLSSNNQYISLLLVGRSCNRDGIGARIELDLSGDTPTKLVSTQRAGDAFVSQSSKWQHFGIPNGLGIKRLTVRWPGTTQPEEFVGLVVGSRFRLTQGSGVAIRQEVSMRRSATTNPIAMSLPQPTEAARIVLTRRRKISDVAYVDFTGVKQAISAPLSGPLLLNLWASWCVPCLQELSDLKANAARLQDNGLRLLALSTDGVVDGSGQGSLRKASELMQRFKLPFRTGVASEALLRKLRILQANTFYRDKPLSMPISFLIDSDGEIAIIYRGVVEVDQVIADADLIQTTDRQRIETALYPLGGRSGIGLLPFDELGFAKAYYEGGYYEDVRLELSKLIERTSTPVPNEAGAQRTARRQNLAEAYHLLANSEEAGAHLEAAEHAYQNALRFAPQALGSRVSLAIVLWNQGKQSEADAQLLIAERNGTSPVKTHRLLGSVRMKFGQPKQAARHFRKAYEQSPNDEQLGLDLAVALQADGRTADAVSQYRQLLAMNSSFLQAANNLAWIYATSLDSRIRSAEESLELALQVCRATDNRKPAYLDTLAAAHAENGQFKRAISTAHEAIEIAEKAQQEDLVEQIRQRLKVYQDNKPYREPVGRVP